MTWTNAWVLALSWVAGFYSHHPWVLKPHGMDEGFPRKHLECKKMLPWVAQHARMFYGFFAWFDWIGKHENHEIWVVPFLCLFPAHPPNPSTALSPRKKKHNRTSNGMFAMFGQWIFHHFAISWRSLNPWKGHLTIPKRSQRSDFPRLFCCWSHAAWEHFFSKSGFIPNRPAQNATVPKARHVEWHNAVTRGLCRKAENKRDDWGCFTPRIRGVIWPLLITGSLYGSAENWEMPKRRTCCRNAWAVGGAWSQDNEINVNGKNKDILNRNIAGPSKLYQKLVSALRDAT